jgi:hypothetical protein
MSKRLFQIAVLVMTVYFAVDASTDGMVPEGVRGRAYRAVRHYSDFRREGLLDRQSLISTYHRRHVVTWAALVTLDSSTDEGANDLRLGDEMRLRRFPNLHR